MIEVKLLIYIYLYICVTHTHVVYGVKEIALFWATQLMVVVCKLMHA